MIKFEQKGNFSRTEKYLNKLRKLFDKGKISAYAEEGLKALKANTPKDTGLTASSWYYKIRVSETTGKLTISYYNDNAPNGVPVAILIQYGHATKNGGYVEGIDYINPSLKPVFDRLVKDIWGEITAL